MKKTNSVLRKIHKVSSQKVGIVIILGIACFLLGSSYRLALAHASRSRVVASVSSSAWPTRVAIPDVSMNVGVMQGGIANGDWILGGDSAYYLPTSGKIGEGYNTIIYAHNWDGLFGNLHQVQLGNAIVVTDHTGTAFTYEVFEKQVIDPTDLQKLQSTDKNVITLLTCDGILDTERLVIKAKLR